MIEKMWCPICGDFKTPLSKITYKAGIQEILVDCGHYMYLNLHNIWRIHPDGERYAEASFKEMFGQPLEIDEDTIIEAIREALKKGKLDK